MKVLIRLLVNAYAFLRAISLLASAVAGIWLILIGEWKAVLVAAVFVAGSFFLLSILLLPGFAISAAAVAFFKEGRPRAFGHLLGLLSVLYSAAIVTFWCGALFVAGQSWPSSGSAAPFLLLFFAVAAAPLTYMADKEREARGNSLGAVATTLFALLGYLAMVCTALLGLPLVTSLFLMAFAMLFGVVVQYALFVATRRASGDMGQLQTEFD